MTKDKVEKLMESYDTLVELGVIFHYGSEEIEQGEITSIEFTEVEVNLEDFIENHTKEGNNYHTWNVSREFDNLLES